MTYFAEAGPRSKKTAGLIKVGVSVDPAERCRHLGVRVIGVTAIPEAPIRQALYPFMAAPDDLAERGLPHPREWYYDREAVRRFVAWAIRFRPIEEAEAA